MILNFLPQSKREYYDISDRNKRTYESISLHPEQITLLLFEPVSPDSTSEKVTL